MSKDTSNKNKKSNPTIKKTRLCFGDFEYSCLDKKTTGGLPIISVGIVICNDKLQIIDSIYKTVKPITNTILSDRCKSLTGITQKEIDCSADFDIVSDECIKLMRHYNIYRMFVWGYGDFRSVQFDFKLHREQGLPSANIKKLRRTINNVEPMLMEKVGLPNHIGLEKLQELFSIECSDLIHHNALDDAILLSRLFYTCTLTDLSKNKNYQQYLKDNIKKNEGQL